MSDLNKYKENGVTFVDENTVYIDSTVEIGSGSIIEPSVCLKGNTVIGKNVTVGFCSEITNSRIGNSVNIKHSVIMDSSIDEGTTVGPFAYIRPNCNVGKNVRVGDFVELKNSNIGDGTKISHLTYVGDSDVGQNINFGCGTVTVNYDGKKKYRTVSKTTPLSAAIPTLLLLLKSAKVHIQPQALPLPRMFPKTALQSQESGRL